MKLFRHTPPTRRAEAARRRQQAIAEQAPAASVSAAYRRHRPLNTRQAATPAEASERLATHQLVQRRRQLGRWLAMSLAGVAAVLSLLWQLAVTAEVLTPDAASGRAAQSYRVVLEAYFQQRPAERLRFLLDHTALTAYFLEQAPEVKTVRLEAGGLASARLKLTFRQPVAQWSAQKTYFVDEDGVTFEKNYFAAPSVVVRDESGVPTTGGQEVVNRRFLSFLGQSVALLAKQGLPVQEAVLPQGAIRQIQFRIKDSPTVIIMTQDREARAQVEQAVRALAWMRQAGQQPRSIDVRVDQRVFYR